MHGRMGRRRVVKIYICWPTGVVLYSSPILDWTRARRSYRRTTDVAVGRLVVIENRVRQGRLLRFGREIHTGSKIFVRLSIGLESLDVTMLIIS